MSYLIDVGRVFHTSDRHNTLDLQLDEIEEDWARRHATSPLYPRILETSASDVLISAASAGGQVAFELDAYLDHYVECDARAEKLGRLNAIYGWWGGFERGCKRMRGFRARGTPGPAFYIDRLYTYHSWKESFQCWKDGRRYQAHGRTSVTWTLINW